jgi:predicted nucleic acid-binding protein
MIVVSDTSPLTALLTVGEADLLLQLFGEVVIPKEVQNELARSHSSLPQWIRVEIVKYPSEAARLCQMVDKGEAEAIELAKELHADHLLIDERKGRRLATQERVPVIGLLGVVLLAKRRRLIPSARTLIGRVEQEAGVYLAITVRDQALRSVGE